MVTVKHVGLLRDLAGHDDFVMPVDGAILEASSVDDVKHLGALLGVRVDVVPAAGHDPFCVWCGEVASRVPEDTLAERINTHVKVCKASPWRSLEAAVRMIAKAEKVGQVMDAITVAQAIVEVIDEGDIPDSVRIAQVVDEWNTESIGAPSSTEVAMLAIGVLQQIAQIPHGEQENKAVTKAQDALAVLDGKVG